jgi:SPP1 gp7 family putative phage head morphogenesis protein
MPGYWERRAQARMDRYLRDAQQTVSTVSRAYQRALRDIQSELERIFEKYARTNQLTREEALAFLSQPVGQSEYKDLLAEIARVRDPEIRRLLQARANAPAYRYRMTRAEALAEQLHARMGRVADVEIGTDAAAFQCTIEDAYGRSMFDIQRGTGHGFSFALPSTDRVQEILRNPWSGQVFSERVWHNAQALADQLNETITAGFMSGRSVYDMADDLEHLTNGGRHAAMRVIRTETCYMANAAEMESYKAAGIEQYEFMATLDNRTSPACQDLDGKVFDVKDAKPGVNLPPLHPHCRSTTVARFDDDTLEGLERRARDPVTGESITVPRDMTYKAWEEQFGSTNIAKRGIINIEMDKWTPCLVDRRTGQIISTETVSVDASKLRLKGWNFDFKKSQKAGNEVFALRLTGDSEIQGLIAFAEDRANKAVKVDIVEVAPHNVGSKGKYKGAGPHLFAFAGKRSIEMGYDFIYFDAKTDLIEHYEKSLGAQQLGRSHRMTLEGRALYDLVSYYYGKSGKDSR